MSDILCGYAGDREGTLMAYLYEEMTPGERAAFDTHLAACARCRVELSGLGEVRQHLSRWSPPTFVAGTDRTALPGPSSLTDRRGASVRGLHAAPRHAPPHAS